MKTIDEILGREDYVRLTPQLKNRVVELAARIRKKLVELDEEDWIIQIKGERRWDDVNVTVQQRKSNVGTYEYLAMDCSTEEDTEYGCTAWLSLEDVGTSYYYGGDFSARIKGVSYNAALRFLNVARQIIEKIGEMEDKKEKAVQTALDETKNI